MHPETLNFEGVNAVGHVVCIRGVTVDSYDFDYDSKIFVFTGEFGVFSPRLIFILETGRIAKQRFYESGVPFMIHSVLSMIPNFMRGKRVTTYYPLQSSEISSVKKALALQSKYYRLQQKYLGCSESLIPGNFFEFVLKCHLEHRERFSL